MPTPYGSRGGLAFGAEELRVLRRALALALHPSPATADDVQDCLRLAASLDEATRESARLRAFLVADLGRYRAALPGTAAGYLALLEEALGAGYRPQPDDLAALRALRGNPTAAALLRHCERVRLTALPGGLASAGQQQEREQPQKKPEERPSAPHPAPNPSPEPAPAPGTPRPTRRPVPTPGEVFPRRKPATPPGQHLAAG
ncbi:hypothetical protein ACWDMR_27390 [Streptomyces althioticus]|uniref:hypothetical protein n=1 Tax=Actinomycetes TaxID=1760 RepID=UPI000523FB87|nr:hypothetical protein [Actinospica acidiphila]ALV50550.1 hypothetical protein ASR50_14775 [Streptomyces sp. 4F]WTC23871.1 hypothetical protein OG872_14835 [Streptomyces althioticus]GGT61386.1 hypothetical protein GCM10010243_45230 [Streptomyces matensis]MBM4829416.1 hypothetical protein [Actinospica acidiphila]GGQ38673.1 hypothetical protein GCM10010250_05990 [Streptomyces althioticus]